jgi:hypothetical protein
MGLFDFFKPKPNPLADFYGKMSNQIFPKGDKDINAATSELLNILNNKISKETAKSIFFKSVMISRMSENFDKERLKAHLEGYCIQHFTEAQIQNYFNYLVALKAAMAIHRRTPSEVRREGETYVW